MLINSSRYEFNTCHGGIIASREFLDGNQRGAQNPFSKEAVDLRGKQMPLTTFNSQNVKPTLPLRYSLLGLFTIQNPLSNSADAFHFSLDGLS